MGGRSWAAGRKFLLLLAAFLLAFLTMRWELSSHAAAGEALELHRVWSDGFFVSAALFASVGLLSLVAFWGGFDTLAYGARFLAARFTRFAKSGGKDSGYKSYFDYTRAKRAEREGRQGKAGRLQPLDFIITGLVMLALSVAAMLAQ